MSLIRPFPMGTNPNKTALPSHDRAGHAGDTGLILSPDGGAHFPIAAASVLSTGAVLLAHAVYGLVNRLSKPNIIMRSRVCVGFLQAAKRAQRYTYKYASIEMYPSHEVVDDRDDPFLTGQKTVRQPPRQRNAAALIEEARR